MNSFHLVPTKTDLLVDDVVVDQLVLSQHLQQGVHKVRTGKELQVGLQRQKGALIKVPPPPLRALRTEGGTIKNIATCTSKNLRIPMTIYIKRN